MENMSEHTLSMTNRESISLTGIDDVDSFNEQEIVAISPCGELKISGENLHIEELSLDTGFLSITGKIISLSYTEHYNSSSILKRLFGG